TAEDPAEHPVAHQHRADRDGTAGECLGEKHDVGLYPPMLDREESPGSPEAGLDLVRNEERTVPAAQARQLGEVVVGRQVDALALDRLDEEGGDVTSRERFFGRAKI